MDLDGGLGPATLTAQIAAIRDMTAAGNFATALHAAEKLVAQLPDSGRALQELAHCQLAMGSNAAALGTYRRAASKNDALPDTWQALAQLCQQRGLESEAVAAADCARRLADLPLPLAQASYLLNEGEIEPAESLITGYLQQHGAHVDGMRLLAQIAIKLAVLDDAEILLENVLERRPDYTEARFEYASVLAQRRSYVPALQEIRQLLARQPDNPFYLKLYASICDGLGNGAEALRVYRALSRAAPEDADLLLSMANILQAQGEADASLGFLKNAAQVPAAFARASFALSNRKSYRFDDAQIAAMRAAEADVQAPLADRYQLCYALGRAFERRHDYAESFQHYARGNALKRSEIKTDPRILERTMQRQQDICTPALFAQRRGFGCPRPDPIFIVGMPRAGSTLLEQILATHSMIDGTGELPDIPRLVHQFRSRDRQLPPPYPAVLADLTPAECARMGEIYLDGAQVFRRGAPYFLDKMPNNFRDLGLIHLILPNARIIDARREPMSCCFGNFKQLFPNGMEFKYSLEEIGSYYRHYVDLMDHWMRVLPEKILRVQHEEVVDDLRGSVVRMLDFLGLPFEERCLEFWKTSRTVRTVSADQVRQPIYREGLDQWRHFEPWLEPLKAALAGEIA
jgi:thioredoxin-like negative regulator of GroEL